MTPWLREHLESARVWIMAVIVSPAWGWMRLHWSGFWWSSPVVWISIFWAADWLLGSYRALTAGTFRPRRAAASVGKLMAWLAVLMVAWGLRDSTMLGGGLAASCLEAGVLLAEASSVLYHLGELTGSPVLRFYAAKFRSQSEGK